MPVSAGSKRTTIAVGRNVRVDSAAEVVAIYESRRVDAANEADQDAPFQHAARSICAWAHGRRAHAPQLVSRRCCSPGKRRVLADVQGNLPGDARHAQPVVA